MKLLWIALLTSTAVCTAVPRARADEAEPVAVLKDVFGPARFSPDGRVLATLTEKSIVLWDTTRWNKVATLKVGGVLPAEVVFSSDGKMLAATVDAKDPAEDGDGGVRVWELSTRKKRWSLKLKEKELAAPVVFSPNGRILVTAHIGEHHSSVEDGDDELDKLSIKRWDIVADKELPMPEPKTDPSAKLVFTAFGNRLWSEKPDLNVGALAEGKWPVSVWMSMFDPNRKSIHGRWQATVPRIYNGKFWDKVFGGKAGREVKLLDKATGKTTSLKHEQRIARLAFSPDGKLLAVGEKEGTLWLWETASKKKLWWTGEVKTDYVAFSPDGKLLLSGCSFRGYTLQIKVWEVAAILKGKPQK